MKFLNYFILVLFLCTSIFAQENCRPTINGQFNYQETDCQNLIYSTTLQLNISDWNEPVVLDYVKTRFSFNIEGLEFVSANMINFTIENGYTYEVYLSSDGAKIWVEFELEDGEDGFEIIPGNTFYDCVQLNFTILDCNEFANICPFEPQIFQAEDVNGNLTIGEWLCDESGLPVELTSFTANNVNNNVILNWETATELNNNGFNILRNGIEIGFVSGYGNSNSPKFYSFTDVPTTSGIYSYRLQQIDVNGTTELSNEISIEIVLNKFELMQNYPNPFNPSTTIGFYLDKAQDITLTIYDVIGTEVKVLSKGPQNEGYNAIVFNADDFASGIYIYTLRTESEVLSKSMTLIK